ncbi:hypothetical protein HX882_33450 [Pseudomonas gingeri]|uniref:Uncharacterized protein n=1 Tax=Pseudomonas gingeri TaxID=117681 RepID=A0A7Y7XL43_9PSED|nr:hypothetical protein [Pseudomonas gingeri]NWC00783.1 hypothetical protein [Pseudomonas gingeri]
MKLRVVGLLVLAVSGVAQAERFKDKNYAACSSEQYMKYYFLATDKKKVDLVKDMLSTKVCFAVSASDREVTVLERKERYSKVSMAFDLGDPFVFWVTNYAFEE